MILHFLIQENPHSDEFCKYYTENLMLLNYYNIVNYTVLIIHKYLITENFTMHKELKIATIFNS